MYSIYYYYYYTPQLIHNTELESFLPLTFSVPYTCRRPWQQPRIERSIPVAVGVAGVADENGDIHKRPTFHPFHYVTTIRSYWINYSNILQRSERRR